jgi:hypothetical protein
MSKEGIATIKNVSMGSLCHRRRKPEEILSDLQVEWVKLALTIQLENAIRRRFPGHSEGTYGRLERWIDEIALLQSGVRFHAETLCRAIISWFAGGVFTSWWNFPRQRYERQGLSFDLTIVKLPHPH